MEEAKEFRKEQPAAENVGTAANVTSSKQGNAQHLRSFIYFLGVCILIEGIVNTSLLMRALEGGAVAAFLIAVLVSVLNMGFVGAGVGYLISLVRKQWPQWQWLLIGLWATVAVVLNLFLGRHREALARLVAKQGQSVEQGAVSITALIQDEVANTPLRPYEWHHLEALLFSLISLALCVIGFYKGYQYLSGRAQDDDRGKKAKRRKVRDELDRAIAEKRTEIRQGLKEISPKYRGHLDELRKDVAGWIENLQKLQNDALNRLQDMQQKWDKRVAADLAESVFAREFSATHPTKIDSSMLKAHRVDNSLNLPFPATEADWNILKEAGIQIDRWENSGMEGFFRLVSAKGDEIDDLVARYMEPIYRQLSTAEKEKQQ